MSKMDKLNEEPQEIPSLAVLTGGKGPPGYDWLSAFPEGTTILFRPKVSQNARWHLQELTVEVAADKGRFVSIRSVNNDATSEIKIWVDPVQFCKDNDFYEEIG